VLFRSAGDKAFQKKWMDIKFSNKKRLAEVVREKCGVVIDPHALFDIQCKRLHEYKRQFMNILFVIYRYAELKGMSDAELKKQVPRVVIFAGKSAPGYYVAKLIIKLINNVADVINVDAKTSHYLKLVFIPNYNVSLAEIIIPASDISQHISTAGTEASGTSNMKFVLNGGLILGTVDGANIEIGEEVGAENIWLFGALAHEVDDIRHDQRYHKVAICDELAGVMKEIRAGAYGDPGIFEPLLSTLTAGADFYIVSKDFPSYIATNKLVDTAYLDRDGWAKKSISAASGMGKFSSDRSIVEYAENIWKIRPVAVPDGANKMI